MMTVTRGFGKRGAHEELTSKENERILGTLTNAFWRKVNVLRQRAEMFELVKEVPPEYSGRWFPGVQWPWDASKFTMNVTKEIVHEAIQTSGAIGGKHREDLKDAVQGVKLANVGLALGGNGAGGPASLTPSDPGKAASAPRKGAL